MPADEKRLIYVTVRSGIATVDETTVPESVEVRVLDFDSMEQDAARFNAELDISDRSYLTLRHSTTLLDLRDMLDDQDDSEDFDEDDEEDDEVSYSTSSDDDESDEDDEETLGYMGDDDDLEEEEEGDDEDDD
jgi:hypothetical protein